MIDTDSSDIGDIKKTHQFKYKVGEDFGGTSETVFEIEIKIPPVITIASSAPYSVTVGESLTIHFTVTPADCVVSFTTVPDASDVFSVAKVTDSKYILNASPYELSQVAEH